MSMQPAPWPDPDPVVAAAVRAMRSARKKEPPLAVMIRDRLGEWLHDEDFTAAFGTRGRPGWSPSRLALVTVLQRAENLTDRMAAEQAGMRLDWKYLLGLPSRTRASTTLCWRSSGRGSRGPGWSRSRWTRC